MVNTEKRLILSKDSCFMNKTWLEKLEYMIYNNSPWHYRFNQIIVRQLHKWTNASISTNTVTCEPIVIQRHKYIWLASGFCYFCTSFLTINFLLNTLRDWFVRLEAIALQKPVLFQKGGWVTRQYQA